MGVCVYECGYFGVVLIYGVVDVIVVIRRVCLPCFHKEKSQLDVWWSFMTLVMLRVTY